MMPLRVHELTERMLHLRAAPVMAQLPASLLKIVAAQLRERHFDAGEALMTEGQPSAALRVVIEGRAAGQAAPLSFGLLPILAQAPAVSTVIAETDGRVLELEPRTLLELIEEHEPLLRAALQRLCEHMYEELHTLPAEVLESRLDGADLEVPPERAFDVAERILFIRSLTGFRTANLNAVAAMARNMVEERHAPGAVLWRQGEVGEVSYFVGAGKLGCARADGKRWRAGPTSVIGGVESLARRARWYTLTAETPVVLFRSSLGAFTDLMVDDFELALAFLGRVGADALGLARQRPRRPGDSE